MCRVGSDLYVSVQMYRKHRDNALLDEVPLNFGQEIAVEQGTVGYELCVFLFVFINLRYFRTKQSPMRRLKSLLWKVVRFWRRVYPVRATFLTKSTGTNGL